MKQSEYWDKRSEKYDLNIRDEDFFLPTIEKARQLVNDTDVILDVGCATGEIGLEIAGFVKHIHGIDTSESMIEKAGIKVRERQIDNADYECRDVSEQSIERESYDKVFAFNVLHLAGNPSQTINRMSELLHENGHILSETPCLGERCWLFRRLIEVFVKFGIAPPIAGLSYGELKQMFLANEFEIIQEEILDDKDKVIWIVARKL